MAKFVFTPPFQAVFCGPPGGGKTTILASAHHNGKVDPRIGTTLMAEFENKPHSIVSKITQTVTLEDLADPDFELDHNGINIIQHLSPEDFKYLVGLIERGVGCTTKIKTLELDSFTAFENKIFMEFQAMQELSKNPKAQEDGYALYGNSLKQVSPLVRRILDIPNLNFIATAHVKAVEANGETTTVPSFNGKTLPTQISGSFPMVALVTVPIDKGERDSRTREVVFMDTRKKGLIGIKNQYQYNTLGESQLYDQDDPILSMILDGCLIPMPAGETSPAIIETKTKTTKTNKENTNSDAN